MASSTASLGTAPPTPRTTRSDRNVREASPRIAPPSDSRHGHRIPGARSVLPDRRGVEIRIPDQPDQQLQPLPPVFRKDVEGDPGYVQRLLGRQRCAELCEPERQWPTRSGRAPRGEEPRQEGRRTGFARRFMQSPEWECSCEPHERVRRIGHDVASDTAGRPEQGDCGIWGSESDGPEVQVAWVGPIML